MSKITENGIEAIIWTTVLRVMVLNGTNQCQLCNRLFCLIGEMIWNPYQLYINGTCETHCCQLYHQWYGLTVLVIWIGYSGANLRLIRPFPLDKRRERVLTINQRLNTSIKSPLTAHKHYPASLPAIFHGLNTYSGYSNFNLSTLALKL